MRNLIKRLEKKGWSGREISDAVAGIRIAKKKTNLDDELLEKRVFRILLVVIIAANFSISVALMPLLIALEGIFLYFILAVLGIAFGLLFELVIRGIEHLESKHHAALAFLIPFTALANIIVITRISNGIASKLGFGNLHSPLAIALAYSAAFVLPYLVYRFVLKVEYYAKE
ncbi:hypothetical protein HYS31_05970 [Candidatus Woesearchaeota archaeon]|nr:hypothetical protein [Candidatus Woesearchaeota archaeon]